MVYPCILLLVGNLEQYGMAEFIVYIFFLIFNICLVISYLVIISDSLLEHSSMDLSNIPNLSQNITDLS